MRTFWSAWLRCRESVGEAWGGDDSDRVLGEDLAGRDANLFLSDSASPGRVTSLTKRSVDLKAHAAVSIEPTRALCRTDAPIVHPQVSGTGSLPPLEQGFYASLCSSARWHRCTRPSRAQRRQLVGGFRG